MKWYSIGASVKLLRGLKVCLKEFFNCFAIRWVLCTSRVSIETVFNNGIYFVCQQPIFRKGEMDSNS